MKLLVLGGTRFVGRAIVQDALARGWQVSALHRGQTGSLDPQVEVLLADRTDPAAVAAAVSGGGWDAVVDTWHGSPSVVTEAARALVGRSDRFAYISSSSVYAWGHHVDETSPVVDGDAGSHESRDYAAAKRGSELGVVDSFPDALIARAGLILGPHEDIGRLPWWLGRIARGGRVVAPGAPGRPLQYVDARDLAAFVLTGLAQSVCGPYDVISRSGHATTAELLTACVDATGSDAELVWVDEQRLADVGAQPWIQLPCWVPTGGEFTGFLEADTSKAADAGLVCRPVEETVTDTWDWMSTAPPPPPRPDRPVHGLPLDIERTLLSRTP